MKKTILLCLTLAVFAFSTIAQSDSGGSAIEGVVRDANGAVVPGASVVVKNAETGLQRSTVTRGDGSFNLPVLPVGSYKITISATNFQTWETERRISVGEATTIEAALVPPGASEVVTITSNDENIDVSAAVTGTTISQRAVQDLPVRGRNFTEFVQLTPGVVQESDRAGIVVAGQRSINSNVAVDGADFNDALQGNQRGGNEQVFFFPQSAIREFQVVRSGASAEIGRTNAGFVNVVTKGGTNDIRGELFYFNRNKRLTSPDAFGQDLNNAQNQFGGSIGGALKKDRIFYFVAAEQNFLRVPFVVKFQPVPNVTLPSSLAALEGEAFGTNNPTAVFGRMDFTLSEKNTLNVQYTYTRFKGENFSFENPRQDIAVEGNYTRSNSSNGLKSSLVTVFSPNVINDLRAQFATDNRIEEPNTTSGQAVIANFGTVGGDRGRPRLFEVTRYQIADNLSWDLGGHSLRMGVDANINSLRQQRESNTTPRFDFENRTISGNVVSSLENFINGRPRRFRQSFPVTNNPEDLVFRGTQKEVALFIQDKYRINQRLTLNGGFRWEAQINPQPRNPNPAIPQTQRIPNDLKMFQPRLGAAIDVTGRGETVIRLSAGIFAARTPGNLFQRVTTNNGINVLETEIAETTACRNSVVVELAGCRLRGPNAIVRFPNNLPGIASGFVTLPRVFGFDPDFRNPRSFQASATLEQKIGANYVLTLGFVRNSTWNLQRRVDRNLFPPTLNAAGFPIFSTTRPNPTIAQLEINQSSAHSSYNGFSASLTRRFANRFLIQANYTFAETLDDDSNERNFSREPTQNPFNLAGEAGPSKQDVRHNANIGTVVDLGYGFTFSGMVVTRSGFPLTGLIEDGADFNGDLNDANDRATVNGVLSGRNAFRQRNFFNLDVRLLKAFKFGERRRLDLSAEVFNVTRNTNKGFGVDGVTNFCTSSAALADTANPLNVTCPTGYFPSVRAMEPLAAPSTARFGGPRQMQLGLRFVF